MIDRVHSLTLGDLLRENRRSHPLRTAVVCGDDRATWPELDERVNRLANALRADGVEAGERVLWLGQNCHRLLEALLAAAKLGAVLCPANWRQSPSELAFVIDDIAPRVVIWQDEEVGPQISDARKLTDAGARWLQHDAEGEGSYEAYLAAGSPEDPDLAVDSTAPVLLFYTGAFDGRPNGALISHLAFVVEDLVIAALQRLDTETVYLNSGPLFHVGSFMTTMATFHMGGTNVFTRRWDPEEFCQLVQDEKVTTAFVVGPMIDGPLEANKDRRYDLSSLRMGSASDEWNAMVTPESTPWTEGSGGYGQTEVTGLVTFRGIGGASEGPHGRPMPLAQVAILDDEGNELPPGEVGEIAVRGPTAMVAYHNRPEVNERRQRGGWHHTHDLGRREPDGSLTFIGPKTTMIKSGVENIYPAEVEGCLRTHPAVADVCVIGVPDPEWSQVVKAVVILAPGQECAAEELIEHCRANIASYKKPKVVEFTDELPRDEIGFVDRAAVDEQFGGGGYPGPSRVRG